MKNELIKEKQECERLIEKILNNFAAKWQPSDIDLDVYRTSGCGVLLVSVDIKIEY